LHSLSDLIRFWKTQFKNPLMAFYDLIANYYLYLFLQYLV